MKQKNSKPFHNYIRYSSLASQMIIIILCGTFGGLYIDDALRVKPLFTVLLSLFSVVFAIYIAIKDFLKKK